MITEIYTTAKMTVNPRLILFIHVFVVIWGIILVQISFGARIILFIIKDVIIIILSHLRKLSRLYLNEWGATKLGHTACNFSLPTSRGANHQDVSGSYLLP
jgi:hypothetical protein